MADGDLDEPVRGLARPLDERPGCLPRFLRTLFVPGLWPFGAHDDDDGHDVEDETIGWLEQLGFISPTRAGCMCVLLVVLGMCVVTTLGILGIGINDSTGIEVVRERGVVTPPAKMPGPTGQQPSVPLLQAWQLGYVHGPNRFNTPSLVQVCALFLGIPPEAMVTFEGTGGEGALTVRSAVDSKGRVQAEGGISQYGIKTFVSATETPSGGSTPVPITFGQPLSINVKGGASRPCDLGSLKLPATTPEKPPKKPSPRPTEREVTRETTTDGFPWSLFVALGLDLGLVALLLGGGRSEPDVGLSGRDPR
jgi:hypothetical protein